MTEVNSMCEIIFVVLETNLQKRLNCTPVPTFIGTLS
jgi:hypothetical protein